MPSLINGDTLHDTITIDKASGTVIRMDTDGKYLEKDIKLTLNVQSGSVSVPNVSVTTNPTISFDANTGVVTATNSASETISATVSTGFVGGGTISGTATISGSSTHTVPIASVSETMAYLGIASA